MGFRVLGFRVLGFRVSVIWRPEQLERGVSFGAGVQHTVSGLHEGVHSPVHSGFYIRSLGRSPPQFIRTVLQSREPHLRTSETVSPKLKKLQLSSSSRSVLGITGSAVGT